jgi:uncharacterized protein (DUF1697 family)
MKNTNNQDANYVAFLRGINVGKNNQVRMEDLRKCFNTMGFSNASTISVAGNVLFGAQSTELDELSNSVERNLKKQFKFDIPVSVRSLNYIKEIIELNPFKNVEVTENTRLYVTFYSGYVDHKLKLPYKSADGDFKIIKITEGEIFSVLNINSNTSTPLLMTFLDKTFGKRCTTRNWNTVLKVVN